MSKVVVDKEKCKGCFLCINFCPKQALVIDNGLNKKGNKAVSVKKGNVCIGCGMCAIICPDCCIEIYK